MNKKYLIVPVIKNPYSRIGSKHGQDWYRQIERTAAIARELKSGRSEVIIAIISDFRPEGKPSEIEIYTRALFELAPELQVHSYKETNDTVGQVERSFELGKEMGAELIFVS